MYPFALRHLNYVTYQEGSESSDSSVSAAYKWTMNDQHNNGTGTGNEVTYDNDDTATVLVLALLLFILVSVSVVCVQLRGAQQEHASGLNLASDGRTVASSETQRDVEEGSPSKPMDVHVPVIVVVVQEEGEA